MTRSIKPVLLCLFAVLVCGCLPHEKLTGRVIDLTGPVPDAALLGMVWIEDGAKAKPAPDVKDLESTALDAAYEKDMKERGLPVAYTRAFADGNGWFTLDKLHFSAETKKAVKAMKQPVISRITVFAFRRGYLKRAVTAFPKPGEELPYATLILPKPTDWKELYRENTINSLTADYMVRGYSKEFGATKAEKSWMLEYAHSNLWKAYTESDIKGDKKYEELCGHDNSDIIISSTSIQRNPAHEKCAELLKRMGELRDVEGLWIAHSRTSDDAAGSEKELVHIALAALPSGITEPKSYESAILAGVDNAIREKNSGQINLKNEAAGNTEVAQNIYSKGGKAEAYQMLGRTLYGKFLSGSEDLQVAELDARIVPGIRESIAVYYQLMNRPLTAQLVSSGSSSTRTDATNSITDTSTGTIYVRDYKSFKNYTSHELTILKTVPLTIETGTVKHDLKKIGLDFTATASWARSKDRKRTAYLSPDKKGVAVIDATTHSVDIYTPKGEIIRKIPAPKKIEGLVGYSDTRLFDFKGGFGDYDGGFYIYDLAGKLVKKVEDSGVVDVFMVSNNQKYVAVTAGFPEGGNFLILYDMNGTELWRQKTVSGGKTKIQFSLDDMYVLVKMPIYWIDSHGKPQDRKLYIFNVDNGTLLSEEHYED